MNELYPTHSIAAGLAALARRWPKVQSTSSDAPVFVIVTVRGPDPGGITANLRGPVVVNERTRFAKQLILSDDLPTRFPVWAEPSTMPTEPGHACAPAGLSG